MKGWKGELLVRKVKHVIRALAFKNYSWKDWRKKHSKGLYPNQSEAEMIQRHVAFYLSVAILHSSMVKKKKLWEQIDWESDQDIFWDDLYDMVSNSDDESDSEYHFICCLKNTKTPTNKYNH